MIEESALKICLIDDDRIYQFAARKAMQSLGLNSQLSNFSNGKEAISWLQTLPGHLPSSLPDYIFVDLNMPVLDGWGFLDGLQPLLVQWIKRPEIYVVSSSIDDRDIVRSRSYAYVSDYLVKPVHKERFRQVISQHRRPSHLHVVNGRA